MRLRPYNLFIRGVSPAINAFLSFRAHKGSFNGIENGVVSIAFDDGLKNQFDHAFPLMKARRISGTFYVVTDKVRDFSGDPSFMSLAELHKLEAYGNEIGSHGKTHARFPSLSSKHIHHECSSSREVLQSHGFKAKNFAYPFGDTNKRVNSIVSQYYHTGRSGYKKPYLMHLSLPQFELMGYAGETTNSNVLLRLRHILNMVALTKSYAIVFFHNIIPSKCVRRITISPKDFCSFLDYGVSIGINFLPVNLALDYAQTFPSNAGTVRALNSFLI